MAGHRFGILSFPPFSISHSNHSTSQKKRKRYQATALQRNPSGSLNLATAGRPTSYATCGVTHRVTVPAEFPVSAQAPEAQLKVSAYERVASMIVALLILVGFLVILLFLIWLTNRVFVSQQAVPIEYLDELPGGEAALGSGRDFEEPGIEELQELSEPALHNMLAAVTDVASSQAVGADTLEGAAAQGHGGGDRRRAGAGGDASVPRWQRWEIQFSSTSLSEYAKQLDFFGIELAAAGGGSERIDYAGDLSQATPSRRSQSGNEEDRLYMTWRGGRLQEYDRQLLARAGISTNDRIVLQFYPPQAEAVLAALERKQAGNRSLKDIRRTIFGVRRTGGRYAFYVIDQLYR